MIAEILSESIKLKIPPYQRFIVIRDGLAETQFFDYCNEEIKALRAAVKDNQAYANVKPKIVYIIAQKRHICRIGADSGGEIETPPAGTVLDNTVTGREKHDFYMVTHKALIGSAKPIHYNVHLNELNLTNEQIQDLLFKLCHLHPGCTKSVSLPLPLYNAHKLGYRMGQVFRAAMEFDDDTKSAASGDSGTSDSYEQIQLTPLLKFAPFFL